MPDNIDAHIKSLHSKLQLLLKKHALLMKENEQLIKENSKYQTSQKELNEEKEQLQMQVAILKTSAGKLEGTGDMVAVLMRHQNAGYFVGGNRQARQLFKRSARGESAIDEELGITGIDNQAISPTAAAQ